jgi:alpha-mannosidase
VASARAHNIPPRVTLARQAGGSGALTRSFLRIDRRAGDVILSAFKQAEDRASVIVRLFNPGDEDAEVLVSTDQRTRNAFAVNLLEERQGPLPVESGTIRLRFTPKQIQTIELVP